MKRLKFQLLALALAVPTAVATGLVWAHGDEHVDPNMKVDNPIQAEETAFGRQGASREVSRTIDITMNDMMRFGPDKLTFQQGETVRLRIKNVGKIPHEFVLGTKEDIAEHAAMMKKNPEMEHADASSARVAPGKTADIIWQFSKAGNFLYACLIPGHWEAGMQGTVTVVAVKAGSASMPVTAQMAGMGKAH